MSEIIIDATNHVAGRLASFAAKQALNGENVIIINSEKAVIVGDPVHIQKEHLRKVRELGQPQYGPFILTLPDRFLRRIIRGMLPKYSWAEGSRGRMAYDRVMCYIGETEKYKGKGIKIEKAMNRSNTFLTVGQLCKMLGGKR